MSSLWLLLFATGVLAIVLGTWRMVLVWNSWPTTIATITGGKAWRETSRAYFGEQADGWPAGGWTRWEEDRGASGDFTFTYQVGDETFSVTRRFTTVVDKTPLADEKEVRREEIPFSYSSAVPGATNFRSFQIRYDPKNPRSVALAPKISILGGLSTIAGLNAAVNGLVFWLTSSPIETVFGVMIFLVALPVLLIIGVVKIAGDHTEFSITDIGRYRKAPGRKSDLRRGGSDPKTPL